MEMKVEYKAAIIYVGIILTKPSRYYHTCED